MQELSKEELLRLLLKEREEHEASKKRLRQTEERLAMQTLAASRPVLQELLLRIANDGFAAHVLADTNGEIVYANPAANKLLATELLGCSVHDMILQRVVRRDQASNGNTPSSATSSRFGNELWERVIVKGEGLRRERERVVLCSLEGNKHDVSFVLKAIEYPSGRFWAHLEITDIGAILKDKISGLYLQEAGINALERKIKEREREHGLEGAQELSFVFIDIDDFKRFNELHGYDAGDLVIRETADAIRKSLRGTDLACRWFSGDEFAAIVEHAPGHGELVAKRIHQAIGSIRIIWKEHMTLKVTTSIGVATWRSGETYEVLANRAKENAKISKLAGKRRVTADRMPALSKDLLKDRG